MHAVTEPDDEALARAGDAASTPQVRTLLLTDLCDSTLLVEKLGDAAAAELFREHDRLVLGLQQRWHGRLIDRSDGLMLLFERAIDGLGFALDYARGLREIAERRNLGRQGIELRARSGLHVGEVLMWRNSDAAVSFGAKPLEVEGLAKPMAGRLMTLARPGQILLSATAEPLAHRAARELGERGEQLVWKSWNRWRFKGVPQAQEVYEVGEPGIAPLRAPQQIRGKAWRDIPLWRRPAALAAELLLVAGLATSGWFLTRPQPAIAFGERDWVVVADLRNLTGDTLLDESLEQAFRISLEQSRYVNVLSDLKARDTLQRMRRSPGTTLDRAIASEIALRDGARAVILPTVAEIGGRVRVSAEVIDPHTQTTVYAESADGTGAVSALASIDDVTAALRGRLGEALQAIEQSSVSLPNVTTSNLDALKAYAIGRQHQAKGDRNSAIAFYARAATLDPNFALAVLSRARAEAALGKFSDSNVHYRQAQRLRDHLPPKEALQLDAAVAARTSTESGLQHWKQAVALYPDMHDAWFQLAQSQMFDAGLYEEALPAIEEAIAAQSPFRARALYLKGMILLGLGRVDEGLVAFNQSKKQGYEGAGVTHALAYVAKRDYPAAEKAIAARNGTGSPVSELEVERYRVFVAVDKHDWDAAASATDAGLAKALGLGSGIAKAEWRNRAIAVSVLSGEARHASTTRTNAEIDRLLAERKALSGEYPEADVYFLLGAGYLGARADSPGVVRRILGLVAKADVDGDPMLEQMRAVLLAEQWRLEGGAGKSIEALGPLAGQKGASMPVHAALLRAARAAGQDTTVQREARWLAAHRGRAFVEEGVNHLATPFNIRDANEAQATVKSLARSKL